MKILNLFGLAVLLVIAAGCGQSKGPLDVVDYVDVEAYQGRWYEIASFPQSFQAGCTGTKTDYALQSDGSIKVVNSCREGSLDGPEKKVTGTAWVVDDTTNAKLNVRFFIFTGDYWILELGENYEYAVVGHPSRDFLWILSRTPTLDDGVLDGILERIEGKNFDLNRLQFTEQPA